MDLEPDDLPELRNAVTAFLRELKGHLPETDILVMVGMAAGADLLVAQTALDAGVRIEAVLPMPLEHYSADFEPDTLQLLRGLLARPDVRCTELHAPPHRGGDAGGGMHRDRLYSNLTETLIRRSSMMLALWDGQSSPLPGGTTDTVLRFLGVRSDANQASAGITLVEAEDDGHEGHERPVYWIPTARSSGAPADPQRRPCYLRSVGDNTLLMQRSMPASLAFRLAGLDRYNREYRELMAAGSLGKSWPLMDAVLPETPPRERELLAEIDAQYVKADLLAMHFQQRSERLFRLFAVMTFALGLAYLSYEKLDETRLLLVVYVVILLGGLGLYYALRNRHWFAKHLSYRALAETMRAKFYLRLAGIDHRVNAAEVMALSGIDRFHGFGWISFVLAGVEVPDVHGEQAHDPELRRTRSVETHWIESQHKYFTRKVAQLGHNHHRLVLLRNVLFVVILAVITTLFLFGERLGEIHVHGEMSLKNILTFFMGFLAVLLGVWELHQDKMATRELLWQYQNQLEHFARARLDLRRFVTAHRRNEVLVGLGRESLMECYLWTIHRYHREHEPPTGG